MSSITQTFFFRACLSFFLFFTSVTFISAHEPFDIDKWQIATIDFTHADLPQLSETSNNPNPFMDFRLNVIFTSPSGKVYTVPGYYAGDGHGGSSGKVWQVRFTPSELGKWHYQASFRQGTNVAIDLSSNAGTPAYFDGHSNEFTVHPPNANAPGFFKWGLLQATNTRYRKFAEAGSPYYLKTGVDSPENFLAYVGFDNTFDFGEAPAGTFLHAFPNHRQHWNSGDPDFTRADDPGPDYPPYRDAKGIIGALNYLSNQGVNSIYIIPTTMGGDGYDSYPFVSSEKTPDATSHYDLSKLNQWYTVFKHAQEKGILLHLVLAERGRENWWTSDWSFSNERKLYFREMVARFGHFLALEWNLGEEFSETPKDNLTNMINYLAQLNYHQHAITFHTLHNDLDYYRDPQFIGNPNLTATSIYFSAQNASAYTEELVNTNRSVPWNVYLDEMHGGFELIQPDNARKQVLYSVLFSGGAGTEWFFGSIPDLATEDFTPFQSLYNQSTYARRLMEAYLPFPEMSPSDQLVSSENSAYGGAQVLAKAGSHYAIYLPNANPSGTLDLACGSCNRTFYQTWFNPRTGVIASTSTIQGGNQVSLGSPPSDPDEDWVVLVTADPLGEAPTPLPTSLISPTPKPPIPAGAFLPQNGIFVMEVETIPPTGSWQLQTEIEGFTGAGYYNWTGPDQLNNPGVGTLQYPLKVTEAGTYHIRIHNRHIHPDTTQENDIWMQMDDSPWIKTFSLEEDFWNWFTQFEFPGNPDKPPASFYLEPGVHVLRLSARSANFRIDRIHVFHDSVPESEALDTSLPESPREDTRPGDINKDGHVNGLDYVIFFDNWNKPIPPGDPRADLNNDSHINGLDYIIIFQNWDPL